MATVKGRREINERQVKILKVLLKGPAKGMTRKQIAKDANVSDTQSTLGPTYADQAAAVDAKHNSRSLVSMNYVEAYEDIEPGQMVARVYYKLTPDGVKAAKFYQTKERGGYTKIPGDVIVEAVRRVRTKRIYGIERWSRDDLDVVRSALPSDFVMVPLEDLRQQIINARKRGEFADPDKVAFNRKMTVLKGMVRDYWSGQTTIDGIVDWLESQGDDEEGEEE